MPIILSDIKLAYFPLPKVASTTLKHVFFVLQHDETPKAHRARTGSEVKLHAGEWVARKISEYDPRIYTQYERVVVVRDPIKRFISAYANRVIHHGELSEQTLKATRARRIGVSFDPSIEEFVENLAAYRLASGMIRHHTDPMTYFLGHDLSLFDKVYRIEELSAFIDDLKARTGKDFRLPTLQSGGPKIPVATLPASTLRSIYQFCAGDYALLRDYYSPDAIFAEHAATTREVASA